MAEQRRTVVPTVGATGSVGHLTGRMANLYNTWPYVPSDVGRNIASHLGRPSGTGFTANQRPVIHYRPSLDHTDNPQFGLLLSDNFTSQTKRHYQPHTRSACSLPNLVNKPSQSGFHQLRSRPRTVAVEEKTEYQRLFVPHRLTPTVSQNHMTVGPKGRSGFTEETDLQINTFQEKKLCIVEPHQTLSSVTRRDFMAPSSLQGTEVRPGLRARSSGETGFTRGAVGLLACPTPLLPSAQTKSNAPAERTIGRKEPTGSLLNAPNNQAFPNTPFDGSHFTTHYESMFSHRADHERLNCGGIISAKMDNGYNRRDMDRFIFRGSTSAHVHDYSSQK